MAEELEDVKDSFHEVQDCIVHAQMQSGRIGMSSFSSWINPLEPRNVSFFSSPCGVSSGVPRTVLINLTFSSLQAKKQTYGQKVPVIYF